MQCPYRNMTSESGCDLVDDLYGISGVMVREFCDHRNCQDCPLFQEALQENLRDWSKQGGKSRKQLATTPDEKFASPVAGFWKLAVEHRRHEA